MLTISESAPFVSLATTKGAEEDLPVTHHSSVYPTIDPAVCFENKTYKGKVVFITGASRGIGRETALHYALAGAIVAIASRQQDTLDDAKLAIVSSAPDAKVLTFPVDVRDADQVQAAVDATVAECGKLDILIANAAAVTTFTKSMLEKDAAQWWNTFEVNVRGVYNCLRAALPHLDATKGYAVVLTSVAANIRIPLASDYCTTKHALGRLVEYVLISIWGYVPEFPEVKTFALAPGVILTQIATETEVDLGWNDSVALPAATMLYLTAGNADWLSGRYVSANWDLGEVERDWKDKVMKTGALVNKLSIPRSLD
ncbi:NAD-P-binding protein [Amylostereum chailletii]|nr:NAD-P-binding protein [Amylostereum chailletii]